MHYLIMHIIIYLYLYLQSPYGGTMGDAPTEKSRLQDAQDPPNSPKRYISLSLYIYIYICIVYRLYIYIYIYGIVSILYSVL